ncbi:NAD(P)/FAD-dependent oxidoreductase, partial [Streptomyces milbemycinicus]
MSAESDVEVLRREGRIVVVGASLAGLRAAETLRDMGFTGSLTMIGDEPYEPYDRPPLSKQVLLGRAHAEDTALPRRRDIDAEWRLGVAAESLDRDAKQVRLANDDTVVYDRLLITTGTRARPWFYPEQEALDGVFVLRTRHDAARLYRKLAAGPSRVLVIGAGFTGSEVASACRERGLEVTVVERGPTPLVGA